MSLRKPQRTPLHQGVESGLVRKPVHAGHITAILVVNDDALVCLHVAGERSPVAMLSARRGMQLALLLKLYLRTAFSSL